MHPLSAVLATTVYHEIESSAAAHAVEPRKRSRLSALRSRRAARRDPASPPSYGPRRAVRAGRA